MALRIGFLTAAHLHIWGYAPAFAAHPEAEVVGIWDHDASRGKAFAEKAGMAFVEALDELLRRCDAVVIVSENRRHAELAERAAAAACHILCEKPLATSEAEGQRMIDAARRAGVKLMTAFPCRFSPAYARLKERIANGDIGAVRAICATNRGRCPGGWFVDVEESGGGAMIDHVVHVADLLRDLLGEEPSRVQAQTGSGIHGEMWEDTAMLTLEFPSGVFATLDSSWSRPKSFRTWGDVTMQVVGDAALIEVDMFGQEVQVWSDEAMGHCVAWYGSSLDGALVDAFVRAALDGTEPPVTGEDGLAAARVAFAGYESARSGEAVGV
jgi:predicted dehydrogenase